MIEISEELYNWLVYNFLTYQTLFNMNYTVSGPVVQQFVGHKFEEYKKQFPNPESFQKDLDDIRTNPDSIDLLKKIVEKQEEETKSAIIVD